MSQSKSAYGVESGKDTACTRHAQQSDKPDATANETVEPACRTRDVGRGVDRREWREMPYDGRTRTFYDKCEWCFPAGPPDDSEIETVVRSCRKPTTYHRPQDDGEPCEHNTDAPETGTNGTRISRDAIEPVGAINSLTDLENGQRVVVEVREQPLHVVETTTESDGTVGLHGPAGGEYQVEGRPECPQPYYLRKIGYLTEIIHVHVGIPAEAA